MKIEIRFRVWNPSINKMSIVERCDYMGLHGILYDLVGCNNKDNVWMQYTGLKDKNGTPIYEGDIVKCHYFYEALGENLGVYEAEKEIIGEIDIQEMGLWIQCDTEEDSGYLLWINGLHEDSFEVIGNIYENPELIK